MGSGKEQASRKPLQLFALSFKIFLYATLIILALFSASRFKIAEFFPIKTVRVIGINHLAQQDVKEFIQPLAARGYFAIDIEYIRDRLRQHPWVSDIFVRRVWPDQLEITLIERNALARWNQESLLSTQGELFTPQKESYPEELPLFIGPDGKHIVMLDYFNNMNRVLLPLHTKVSYLELTPYSTWKITLDNGITLQLGHKDILTRLDHFVKVYPKIVGSRTGDVEYVDLRYANGMAVKWKT